MDTTPFQDDVRHIQSVSAAVLEHVAREAARLTPEQRESLLKRLKKGDAKQRSIFAKAIVKLDHIFHRLASRHHAAS